MNSTWRGKGRPEEAVYASTRLHPEARRLLLTLLEGRRRRLLGVIGAFVARSAVATASPILVKLAIDNGIPRLDDGGAGYVAIIFTALCACAVLQAALDFASLAMMARLGQTLLYDLRKRVFNQVQVLGLAFHERYSSGRVIARLTNDMESIDDLFSQGIGLLAWAALTVCTTLVAVFVLDWQLALVVVAFLPFIYGVTRWFRLQSLKASRRIREAAAVLIVHFVESLRGVAAVQAFRRERRNEEILHGLNSEYRNAKVINTRLSAIYGPSLHGLGNVAIATVLVVGGMRVMDGAMTVGTLAAFVLYLRRMVDPIIDLTQFFTLYQSASAAAEKLALLLREKPALQTPDEPVVLASCRGDIEMRDVTFSYGERSDGERNIIEGFDLEIPAGQTVALVGATGAGKSTVARLIARLYDPVAGSVRLDGLDMRIIDKRSLHDSVVMATQENFLFSQTISENIAFGKPDASREEIIEAARAIGAHTMIESLSGQYDSAIGKRGAQLSAGQRQLLSFARAFIADPKVLILDEATSSLDIPTERALQGALKTLLANRTAIVIAHRLSTVEIADRVLVLEGGEIIEDGSPEELSQAGGPYQRLHDEWRRSLASD